MVSLLCSSLPTAARSCSTALACSCTAAMAAAATASGDPCAALHPSRRHTSAEPIEGRGARIWAEGEGAREERSVASSAMRRTEMATEREERRKGARRREEREVPSEVGEEREKRRGREEAPAVAGDVEEEPRREGGALGDCDSHAGSQDDRTWLKPPPRATAGLMGPSLA